MVSEVQPCRLDSLTFLPSPFSLILAKALVTSQKLYFYLDSQHTGLQLFWKPYLLSVPRGPSQWSALSAKSTFNNQAMPQSPHSCWRGREKSKRMAPKRDASPSAVTMALPSSHCHLSPSPSLRRGRVKEGWGRGRQGEYKAVQMDSGGLLAPHLPWAQALPPLPPQVSC